MAWFLGASLPVVAAAAILWLWSIPAKGILQILLRLAAALVVTASAPVPEFDAFRLLLSGALVVATLPPLLESLGPGFPAQRPFLIAGGSILTLLGLFALPPGRAMLSSDLAFGLVATALAAGLLAAAGAVGASARRRND